MNKYLTKISSDRFMAQESEGEERKAITDYTRRLKEADSPELKKAINFALADEKEHAAKFKAVIEKLKKPA
jgi:rubrerythrin